MLPVDNQGVERLMEYSKKNLLDFCKRNHLNFKKKGKVVEGIEAANVPVELKDFRRKLTCGIRGREEKLRKSEKTQKFWAYRMDVSRVNPEDIKIGLEDNSKVCVYVNNHRPQKPPGGGDAFDVKKTVYLPKSVNVYDISIYISDDGMLVIQAPYLNRTTVRQGGSACSEMLDTCVVNRKRKYSDPEIKDSDIEPGLSETTDNQQDKEKGKSANSKKIKLELDRSDDEHDKDIDSDNHAQNVKTNTGTSTESSRCQNVKCECDSEVVDREGRDEKSKNDAQNEEKVPELQGKESEKLETGKSNLKADFKCHSYFNDDQVVLKIPVKDFFPELNKVNIFVKEKTLTFKSERIVTSGGIKLSEVFVKEFSFPAHFDICTLKLGRDTDGNVLVRVKRRNLNKS